MAEYDALEKLFHEPNRLAIMSELCGSAEGVAFNDLKNACGLTDGNLSRHLTTLQNAGAVRIKKGYVEAKPRTTVFASASGRKKFLEYLSALEEVLQEAAKRARALEQKEAASAKRSRSAKTLAKPAKT